MTLTGIKTDYNEPGFRHIIFRPQPVDDLSFVKYFNNTPYGKAGIFWKREKGSFSMEIIIPVRCYATVYVPVNKDIELLKISSEVVWAVDEGGSFMVGAKFLKFAPGDQRRLREWLLECVRAFKEGRSIV